MAGSQSCTCGSRASDETIVGVGSDGGTDREIEENQRFVSIFIVPVFVEKLGCHYMGKTHAVTDTIKDVFGCFCG